MINYGYHLALWRGKLWRNISRLAIPFLVRQKITPARSFPFEVFAYSSEETVPEQIRSIRSFIRYAGQPRRFHVISDGSHSARSIRLLQAIEGVSVHPAGENLPPDLPPKFRQYLTTHPLGKQLGLFMSLPRNGPALYLDSDVLFFPGAALLADVATGVKAPAFYLPDCQTCSADTRLFRTPEEVSADPVNCGFLFLFQKLDWSLGIRRFLELEGDPTFFTNQTITHLVMHANGALPLDPRECVLQLDDQTLFGDNHAKRGIILRHYVRPVRHKFWTAKS